MATYYAYAQASGGANNGSKADPWEGVAGLQTALDTIAAGDVLYIAGTYTLAAALDIDQHSGSYGSPIRVIGCHYDGGDFTVDGTKAVIDADGAAAHCLAIADRDAWLWEHTDFRNATGDNVWITSADNAQQWAFFRCDSQGAGGDGWGGDGKLWRWCQFLRCRALGNGADGFSSTYDTACLHQCVAIGNGGHGFNMYYSGSAVECIAHANGQCGFYGYTISASLLRCVADGNGADGMSFAQTQPLLISGCRITNNTGWGLQMGAGRGTYELNNVFLGNGSGAVNIADTFHEDGGAETRITAGADGYEDRDGDVFNCRVGAAGYRTEVALGGGNCARFCPGLPTVVLPRVGGL